MKRASLLAVLVGILAVPLSDSPVSATSLTFQGGVDGDHPTQFAGGIPSIYGNRDTGLLGSLVNQYDLEGNGWTPHISTDWLGGAYLWGGEDFGSLQTVAQLQARGGYGQLALIPDAGFSVVLNSLDIAAPAYLPPRYQTVRVLDASFNILWGGTFAVPTEGALHLTPNISSSDRLYLQFGTETWIGMSNINFDEFDTQTPVPEPASLLLFGTGLVGMRAWRKRRQ